MEDDVFIKKMKGVQPIKNKENTNYKLTRTIKKIHTKKKTKSTQEMENQPEQKTTHKPKYNLSFGEINKDLKRGRIKVDRRLDLHGYSLIEAEERFKNEVIKLFNKNKRCLLVITGKGVHLKKNETNFYENDTPKLYYGRIKNSIIQWIQDESLKKYILTYQDAGIEHGADGAIFVYLRRNKN